MNFILLTVYFTVNFIFIIAQAKDYKFVVTASNQNQCIDAALCEQHSNFLTVFRKASDRQDDSISIIFIDNEYFLTNLLKNYFTITYPNENTSFKWSNSKNNNPRKIMIKGQPLENSGVGANAVKINFIDDFFSLEVMQIDLVIENIEFIFPKY